MIENSICFWMILINFQKIISQKLKLKLVAESCIDSLHQVIVKFKDDILRFNGKKSSNVHSSSLQNSHR